VALKQAGERFAGAGEIAGGFGIGRPGGEQFSGGCGLVFVAWLGVALLLEPLAVNVSRGAGKGLASCIRDLAGFYPLWRVVTSEDGLTRRTRNGGPK
jgi:hypothetical protein